MTNSKRNFWKNVLIVVGVFLLILIFLDYYFKWKERNLTDDERLKKLIAEKEKYYNGVSRAVKNEIWIYLVSRSFIVLILITLNFYYFFNFNDNYELGKQININEAVVLGYSFIAFAIAGTPSKFVKLLRVTIFRYRKRAHIGDLDIKEIELQIEKIEAKIKKN